MNLRPSGYEPDELPGCSTPRQLRVPSKYFDGLLFAEPEIRPLDAGWISAQTKKPPLGENRQRPVADL